MQSLALLGGSGEETKEKAGFQEGNKASWGFDPAQPEA